MSGTVEEGVRQALEAERARLERRCRELEEQMARLQSERDAVVSRLGNVVALLRDGDTERLEVADDVGAPAEAGGDHSGHASDPVGIALSVLEERGGSPVHYRELADLVRQRGAELGGLDPAQTLVSMLVNDDRFVRPFRRGWYALRVHYPKARNVGARRRGSRRAVRQRARPG